MEIQFVLPNLHARIHQWSINQVWKKRWTFEQKSKFEKVYLCIFWQIQKIFLHFIIFLTFI